MLWTHEVVPSSSAGARRPNFQPSRSSFGSGMRDKWDKESQCSAGTTAYFPNVAWPDQQVNIAVEYPGFDRYFDEEEREPRLRWATFQHNYRVAVHLIPPLLEPFVETYPLPGLDTHLTSFSPVGLVLAIVQSLPPFSEFHNNIAASAHMLFLRDLRIAMFVLKQRYVEHFGRRGSEYLMDVARGVVRHIDVFSLTAWRVWAGEKAALIAGYLDMRAVASFAAAVERQDWDPEKEKPDQQQIAAEYWIGWRMANAFLVVCIYQSSPKGY
ncbi:hypothetical protein JCM8547_004400 [Rhodosporidiobolus lusitaniae]